MQVDRSIIDLIALGLHFAGDIGGMTAAYGPIGHGGSERLIVYPGLLWLLAFGGYLMASPASATESIDRTGLTCLGVSTKQKRLGAYFFSHISHKTSFYIPKKETI
ncbi:MAG: hypothetical protein ACETV1_07000 [Candidatus Bathyarchaeia archaeon]